MSTSSKNAKARNNNKHKKYTCACPNTNECSGVTAVFSVVRDKRARFVAVPNDDPQVCALWLEHLNVEIFASTTADIAASSKDTQQQLYVALHHFHPDILETAVLLPDNNNTLALLEPARVAQDLSLSAHLHDQMVFPNYNFETVKEDAQREFKLYREKQQQLRQTSTTTTKATAVSTSGTNGSNASSSLLPTSEPSKPHTTTVKPAPNASTLDKLSTNIVSGDVVTVNNTVNDASPIVEESNNKLDTNTFAMGFEGPIDVDGLTESFLRSRQCVQGARRNDTVEQQTQNETATLQLLKRSDYQIPELVPLTRLTDSVVAHSETMAIMTAIESKRRCWAMTELETMRLEWNFYKLIISRMLKQTESVDDLLECSFNAFAVYSLMLNDIYNDSFLDDKDKMVFGVDKRTKLSEERQPTKPKAAVAIADGSVTSLQSVVDTLLATADRIKESLASLDTDVYAMSDLKAEVVTSTLKMVKEGDAIMYDLKYVESKIQEAWERFDTAAASAVSASKKQPREYDRWLSEASYKYTIKNGTSFWKARHKAMKNIFADVITLDAHRRNRTKEILLSILPRRRTIILRIMETMNPPTANDVDNPQLGMDAIGDEIEKALQQLSLTNLSNYKPNRSSIMNRSRTLNLIEPNAAVIMQPLETRNLFESHLVHSIKTVHIRITGKGDWLIGKGDWLLGLVVITVDDYLHVIVGDDGTTIKAVDFEGDSNEAELFLKMKLNIVQPKVSISLIECKCSLTPDHSYIDLMSKVNPLWGGQSKVQIRLFSPAETFDWYEAKLDRWSAPSYSSEKAEI